MPGSEDPEWLTALAESLRKGDEVLVNNRSRPLTVTERTTSDGTGSTYPHHHVWMEGNGTEYILVHHSVREYEPKLYSASEWSWRTYEEDHIDDELYFKTGAGESVRSLEVTEERAILSDTTAEEFVEPTVAETTWAGAYDPAPESPSGDVLGGCPDCGADIVESQKKATCTGCSLWCPVDEWRAYDAE
ncbi:MULTISPECIES: hypothetical protein [Halobacterium]|uniref:hypothetical protein n=1 Tax=Halobacterium TaxID=2239 RepID=UPI00196644FB|nr:MULTISPECIES: hypothetical protein [Halobacterium]MDL0127101.1 hypothetical protein [Halobacterium salinarum]QRY21769.1 hypothetical protein JT689_01520 [Halobacterium sp. GSL-19]